MWWQKRIYLVRRNFWSSSKMIFMNERGYVKCKTCKGSGKIPLVVTERYGIIKQTCPNCSGEGVITWLEELFTETIQNGK
jgi:DnaJ-class molecular chaperone